MLWHLAIFLSFLWLRSISLYVCICVYRHISIIYSPIDGHLSCFHTLAIISNAAMNISMYVSFQISVLFVFFRYILKSGIAGPQGSFIFCFLRNLHTVFHSLHCCLYSLHCTSSHSHQWCIRLFSTTLSKYVICGIFFFLMIAIFSD